TSPWRGAMSLPRELKLRQTREGFRLAQEPVRELRKLRGDRDRLKNATIKEANEWLKERKLSGELWEIEAEFEPSVRKEEFGFNLLQAPGQVAIIRCDPKKGVLTLDRTRSGRTDFHPRFSGVYEAPL